MRNRFPKLELRAGDRYNRLTVINHAGIIRASGIMMTAFKFRCDCGTELIAPGSRVKSGAIKSCGCARDEAFRKTITKHGHAAGGRSRTYRAWRDMWDRCTRREHSSFKYYGARGIQVAPDWGTFESFLRDMGESPSGLWLDRVDSDGNYSAANCRWATIGVQQNNRRSNVRVIYKGKQMTAADLARAAGLPQKLVQERLRNGWPVTDAVLPVGTKR